MTNAIYKTVDVIGSSASSLEEAIEGAVGKAAETVHNLDWFEVNEIRGNIRDGKIAHYQIGLKIGFRLD